MTAKQTSVTYVPAGTGRAYRSPIDDITFLITGEQTGSAYFMAAVSVRPGGANPPHIQHREEESLYLQQGTLTVSAPEILFSSPAESRIHFRTPATWTQRSCSWRRPRAWRSSLKRRFIP